MIVYVIITDGRMMTVNNVEMLMDTLTIFNSGEYIRDGKTIHTKLTAEQAKRCSVILPQDVDAIMNRGGLTRPDVPGKTAASIRIPLRRPSKRRRTGTHAATRMGNMFLH